MKIRPLHDRVIVRREEEEQTTAGGILLPIPARYTGVSSHKPVRTNEANRPRCSPLSILSMAE